MNAPERGHSAKACTNPECDWNGQVHTEHPCGKAAPDRHTAKETPQQTHVREAASRLTQWAMALESDPVVSSTAPNSVTRMIGDVITVVNALRRPPL